MLSNYGSILMWAFYYISYIITVSLLKNKLFCKWIIWKQFKKVPFGLVVDFPIYLTVFLKNSLIMLALSLMTHALGSRNLVDWFWSQNLFFLFVFFLFLFFWIHKFHLFCILFYFLLVNRNPDIFHICKNIIFTWADIIISAELLYLHLSSGVLEVDLVW